MTSSDLLTILEHGISFDAAAKFAYDLGWALADDIINKRGNHHRQCLELERSVDQRTALARLLL